MTGQIPQKTILLVEDEALIALSEKMTLEKHGYAVIVATSGEKAIDTVRSGAEISLILMDIDLGSGINGTEAAEAILRDHNIPLVFLSSHTDPEIVAQTQGITSYGYIVKNSGSTVLLASIRMAFQLSGAHQALAESEDRFRHLFENMNDAFVLCEIIDDSHGGPVDCRILEANELLALRLGMKPGDLVGQTVRGLFPDVEESWIEAIARVAATGTPEVFTDHLESTGNYYEASLYCPLHGQCAGVITDTTERMESRDRVVQSEALLKATQQLTRAGGWEYRVDNHTVFWTDETYRLHDLEVGELAEGAPEHIAPSLSCYRPEDQPMVKEAFDVCLAEGKPYDLELPFTTAKGRPLWVRTSAEPEIVDGKVVRVIGTIVDITERKLTEEALQASEERFRAIMNSMQDIVFTLDSSKSHTGVYGPWVENYGYSPDYFLGKTFSEILGEDAAAVHEREFDRALSGEFVIYDWSVPALNGTQHFQTSLAPIKATDGTISGIVGIGRDITDMKIAQHELSRSAEKYQNLAEAADAILWEYDIRTDKWTYVAPQAERILGYAPDEWTDLQFWNSRIHEDDRGWASGYCTECTTRGEDHEFEYRFLAKDGSVVWLRDVVRVEMDANQPVKLRGFMLDITRQKLAEEEASSLLLQRKILLGEIQHRVKNTMHTMGSLLSLGVERLTDPHAIEALNDMKARFGSMEVLYDQLYRTESHNCASLKDYLSELVLRIVGLFPSAGEVTVTTEIENLLLDDKRLSTIGMIVSELITNAMKYAFRNQSDGVLSIAALQDRDRIMISVADNGSSLPDSFDLGESSGFGLSMVRALVDQLHGTIQFETEGGTKATVEFQSEIDVPQAHRLSSAQTVV